MQNNLSAYFSLSFSFVSEKVRVNLQLLARIFVLLTVPFNTFKALQVVYPKIDVQADNSVILANSNSNRRVVGYSPPIQPDLGNNTDLSARLLTQASPILTFQGPGTLLVPILLYHRIDVSTTESQFYVSPNKFEEQMKLLHNWGYTTITTELLVQAIHEGAKLPLHPIILTFDDGHLNNYNIAYPIMKKYGFSGTLYIVGEYIGVSGYMNTDQINEMAGGGWEVGSHSMNHLDLTSLDRQQQQYEIIGSRKFLEAELGIPIQTFAYPFGSNDLTVINLTYSAGYISAVATGYTYNQGDFNLFALQRRGVNGNHDLKTFASFLPWQGDFADLQTEPSVSSQP